MRAAGLAALALTILLFGCSGGGNAVGDNPAAAKRAVSLATFEAMGLDAGLQLPDLAPYWRGAEARNGNTLPYRTTVGTCHLLVRVGSDGKLAVSRSGAWQDATLTAMAATIQDIADANFNKTANASYAEVVLLADRAAPVRVLLEICAKLTACRVANLSMATLDSSCKCLRLLPLFIDLTQTGEEFYSLPPELLPVVARIRLSGDIAKREATFRLLDGKVEARATGPQWGKELCGIRAVAQAEIQRLQADLTPEQTLLDFVEIVVQLAPRGIARYELWLPALRAKAQSTLLPRLPLASYKDVLEIGQRIAPPTVTQMWDSGRGERMAKPVSIDEKTPVVGIAIDGGGKLASRRPGAAWIEHANDSSLLDLLRHSAEESYDPEANVSYVQVVLGVDFHASVEHLLGVQEMLVQARMRVLYLLVLDNVGPVTRLLDISLPDAGAAETKPALLRIQRAATASDFRAELKVGTEGGEVEGPSWLTELTRLALSMKLQAPLLAISAPGVPLWTVLAALDAVASLGLRDLRFVP